MTRAGRMVTASQFEGEQFAVGSLVSFKYKGEILAGHVRKQLSKRAGINVPGERPFDPHYFKIAYNKVTLIKQSPKLDDQMSFQKIEDLANKLMGEHVDKMASDPLDMVAIGSLDSQPAANGVMHIAVISIA